MSVRKPYVPQMSRTSWFMSSARYKTYMLHEVSSVFVAIYSIILIVGLFRLGESRQAWQGWLDAVTSPLGILFHVLALIFFLIHTTSWFKAVPQATRIMRGDEVLPGNILVGAHYGVFAAVSLFFIALAALG
jgi:fumarate reductase subunit C